MSREQHDTWNRSAVSAGPHKQMHLPARSHRRVVWVDHDDPGGRRFRSLFNPEELNVATAAEYGELHAVGWSQPVQQYAHTDAMRYSVNLPVSLHAYLDLGLEYTPVHEAQAFFSSFLYSSDVGESPPLLKMIWPNTAIVLNTVRNVNVKYERWDLYMNVVAYTITLDLVEIRRSFISTSEVGVSSEYGSAKMLLIDQAFNGPNTTVKGDASTGRRLKVSGSTMSQKAGGA